MGSAVNVLPNSPKISDLTNRDVLLLNLSLLMENLDKSAAVQISTVFGTCEHIDSRKVF